MNDAAQKNSTFFSDLLSMIEHYRFTSVLLAIAAIWLIYMLSVPGQDSDRLIALSGPAQPQNAPHVNTRKAFFLLESSQPLSAEEYEARAMYVIARLKEMRDAINVDRMFVFSFHPDNEQGGGFQEQLVSNTFEVNRDDIFPNLYLLQDLSSYAWEHVRNAQLGVYLASGVEGYGVELYGPQKTRIGFLGASSLKKVDLFFTVDLADFKELARKVEIALAYPLPEFQKLQAE